VELSHGGINSISSTATRWSHKKKVNRPAKPLLFRPSAMLVLKAGIRNQYILDTKMTNNKVNEMCDRAIGVINSSGLANFISDETRNILVSEIQTLKNRQDRSLASTLSEQHENNLKHYVKTAHSDPDFSQDFVTLQTDCISLLNEIEAALYVQERFKETP
jgi:hypothetical protein